MAVSVRDDQPHQSFELLFAFFPFNHCLRTPHRRGDVAAGQQRRSVRPAFFWVPANMAGWAVGILWTLAPSTFIDETTPAGVVLAVFVTAGLLMAVTVATVTGFAAQKVIQVTL